MDIAIYDSQYKNVKCVVMESPRLLIKLIPESGGKLQSIYDKKLEKEYLVQNRGEEFIKSVYDSSFGNGDVSGFDEIFPSIESCFYPLEPWKGIKIPDHGEVWALPWSCQINKNAVIMSVNGVRFPYKLSKKIEFTRENTITITYVARNLCNFDLYFSWAPHILFVCEKDANIILPKSVNRIISTCSIDNKLGKFGEIHSWPITEINGERYDISRIYPKYPGKCEKYYAIGELKEGWCAIYNTTTGDSIGLSYPIEKVPYLGIWEGIMKDEYVTALEPCTGDLDYLDTAIQWNRACVIKAGTDYDWYLNITFDHSKEITLIDEQGIIYDK